jgi:stress response protein SCP2
LPAGRSLLPLTPPLVLAAIALAFSLAQTAAGLRAVKRHHDVREAYIRVQVSQGERDIAVTRLNPSHPRSALTSLGDVTSDPGQWKNQAVARYYGIDSIWFDSIQNIP